MIKVDVIKSVSCLNDQNKMADANQICKYTCMRQAFEYKKGDVRCGMIGNKTTIHQSSNEVDVSNYRQLYDLHT